MKQKNKKLLSIILALCIALSCVVGMSATASAEETDTSTYSLVIPSTLNVQNSGWNAVGEISATGTLAQGKKLTVSAESANSFALVSGENSVAYTMKSAEADTEATTAWEFTELPGSAAFGIDVADYSTKPAGTYQDTVTFTASVVSAAKKLTLTCRYVDPSADGFVTKSLTIEYTDNDTWSDIAGRYDEVSIQNNPHGPQGKIIYFWYNNGDGPQLKSNESTYNYKLVSINDKVSAYSSYFLKVG